jgi:protein TonB
LHLVVLTIHFSPIVLKQINDKGPPLEVALVNAKTAAKPAKADVLAQHNLDGGGNTDADRQAKTPLPVLPKNAPDQNIAVATQKVEELEKQTRELMTQLRNAPVAQAMQAPTEARERTDCRRPTSSCRRRSRRCASKRRSPRTWTHTRSVPSGASSARGPRSTASRATSRMASQDRAHRQPQLPGSRPQAEALRQPAAHGVDRADGSVEHVEINPRIRQPHPRRRRGAHRQHVGPFAAFPPDIKKDTDILHITRTWTFRQGRPAGEQVTAAICPCVRAGIDCLSPVAALGSNE